MAGYWPSFFCVFMARDEFEVHKHAKKRTRPISSHLDRISLVIKDLLYGIKQKHQNMINFPCITSEKDSSVHLMKQS